MFIDGKYISKDTWYDADGKPFQPQVHYYVGGATKLYGAALYRLRPQDFGELHHVDGLSPAWPLDLRRLRAVVHARPSGSTRCTATHGEDPTEGPLAQAVPVARGLARAADPAARPTTSQRGGYHPFHAPCGILLDEADRAKSTCIRCTWCDGYPCLVHAKSDAETIAVRPMLDLPERDAARRRRGRRSSRPTPAGRTVTGVVVSRGGAARRRTRPTSSSCRPGRRTRAKLLLRSANDQHPNGLANGSDQVGRNYMFHNSKAVVALSQGAERHRLPEDARASTTSTSARRDYDWPVGNIQMVGKSNAEAMKGEEPKLTKLAPHFVARRRRPSTPSTSGSRPRTCPSPRTGSRVDGDGNVHLAYHSTNDDEADRLYHELKKILNHVGLAEHHVLDKNFYMHMDIPVAGVAHQAGTCRFGTDPATSVLDEQLQGPRARQPLRRRHELLPEHRRREPGAHRDGQRHPRRRAPRRAARP